MRLDVITTPLVVKTIDDLFGRMLFTMRVFHKELTVILLSSSTLSCKFKSSYDCKALTLNYSEPTAEVYDPISPSVSDANVRVS